MEDSASKLLIRLPSSLHQRLKTTARVRGVTLNEFCLQNLQQGLDSKGAQLPAALPNIGLLLNSPFGRNLEGVVLFGSQARGDALDSSDTDLLLCLEQGTDLNRTLYRRWDELVALSPGQIPESLSPHFAVLPELAELAGSLWFEVATDGIVLWDRRLAVSRFLGAVRRYMLSGRVVRKATYGVPYWVRTDAESKAG
jgi:hypothetical protein